MKNVLVLLLPLFFLFGCGDENTAPEIEATLVDGTPFKLSDLRGKYVVMDFWATWCRPCIKSMPKLVELNQKYGDRVHVVTIAFEKDDRSWKAVSERLGLTWKHQIIEKTKVLPLSPIAWSYDVTSIPTKFVITPEGELITGMNFQQIEDYLDSSIN